MEKVKQKRNRKDDENKLVESIRVRFTKAQKENFQKKADAAGKDMATLIRESALKSRVTITSKTDTETKLELKRIGVNVNQITRVMNRHHNVSCMKEDLEKLEKLVDELRETIKKIG